MQNFQNPGSEQRMGNIHAKQNIVILTGAGMSAESGLPTFRDANGLWEGHRVEEVATPEAFARDPVLVHQFYNLRRAALKSVEPNAGHVALSRLEREWSGGFSLITQNVDDLHERAGSRNIVHMHGELRKSRCEKCASVSEWLDDLSTETVCPDCGKCGAMRPHIVWFGEIPFDTDAIFVSLDMADLFICIGTSGVVYPAAGFARQAAMNGRKCHLIELNLTDTDISGDFHECIHGSAATELPILVESILSGSRA